MLFLCKINLYGDLGNEFYDDARFSIKIKKKLPRNLRVAGWFHEAGHILDTIKKMKSEISKSEFHEYLNSDDAEVVAFENGLKLMNKYSINGEIREIYKSRQPSLS